MKLLPFLLLFTTSVLAQDTEGVVIYERKSYWPKIYRRMTWLSQEEKDRIANTARNYDEWKEKMKLSFSASQSLYTYAGEQGESADGQYSWRNADLFLYRNFDQNKTVDVEEMLGKTYIVDDTLRSVSWKIVNQIKDIAGHVCMRADTYDPIKKQKITAWFAQDIPVSAGPERFAGLPGLILELDLNEGDVVIEATKVELKPVGKELAMPKSKGKRIKLTDYDQMLSRHIEEQIKAQHNPYWTIRY